MSRTSETKNKILKSLRSGNKRLTDLCPELDLSAATVSQHLKELKAMHLIKEVYNPHFRNVKYYTLASANERNTEEHYGALNKNTVKYALGIITVLVVASIALFYGVGAPHASTAATPLNILLTDPPHVPTGTQDLNVTYSGIRLHVVNKSIDEWISINKSGSVDLLTLVNVSMLIASTSVPSGAVINEAAFNITNASITINNVAYPLLLWNRTVMTDSGKSLTLNSSSDLLFDFAPTVVPVYLNGTTMFEMLPSLTAAMINKRAFVAGSRVENPQGAMEIDHPTSLILRQREGNINITSANISMYGDKMVLRVNVSDQSPENITLKHLIVIPEDAPDGISRSAFGHSAAIMEYGYQMGPEEPSHGGIPLLFAIYRNGTLIQQFGQYVQAPPPSGIVLVNGQQIMLNFNDSIKMGMPHMAMPYIRMFNSTAYQNYTVMVIGSDASFATHTVN